MSRISLSRKDAVTFLQALRRPVLERDLTREEMLARVRLEAALSPKPKRVAAAKAKRAVKATKRATRRERRANVREQVMARADGVCECGCGRTMREDGFVLRPTLDHFWGRSREESVESCWALADGCHYLKTNNSPSRAEWLEKFGRHAVRHRYAEQARKVAKALAALALSRESAEVGRGAR